MGYKTLSMVFMSKKIILLLFTTLTIIGCFLPWEMAGDLVPYSTYGIYLSPVSQDMDGVLILLLTGLVLYLHLSPAKFILDPHRLGCIYAGLNLALALLFVIRWLIHAVEQRGIIGSATLEFGLILVVLGLAGMFAFTLISTEQREPIYTQPNSSNQIEE
jgi:hypothetical protein